MSVVEVERVESPIRVVDPRVEESARVLDKLRPGWADKVNLDDFDVQNPHKCVLAYVYRSWFRGSKPRGFLRGMADLIAKGYHPYELQFCSGRSNDDWRLEIQARKTR